MDPPPHQPLSWGDAHMHTRWWGVRVRKWPRMEDPATAHGKELPETALSRVFFAS